VFSYRTVASVSNSNSVVLTLPLNMVIEFGTAVYRIAEIGFNCLLFDLAQFDISSVSLAIHV